MNEDLLEFLKEPIPQNRLPLSKKEQIEILKEKCKLYIEVGSDSEAAEISIDIEDHLKTFKLVDSPCALEKFFEKLDNQREYYQTKILGEFYKRN